uniref:AB hydrolase-1 domain-containing protein n=1 Tax=Eutreptiella gymnastica TaxID=73025 RepID=A0A7S1HZ38_9EUGL
MALLAMGLAAACVSLGLDRPSLSALWQASSIASPALRTTGQVPKPLWHARRAGAARGPGAHIVPALKAGARDPLSVDRPDLTASHGLLQLWHGPLLLLALSMALVVGGRWLRRARSVALAALAGVPSAMPCRLQSVELNGQVHQLPVYGTVRPGQTMTVVIPGNPGQGEYYQSMCRGLEERFGLSAIALSYGNFGQTPPPGGVLSIHSEAELKRLQLRQLVEEEGCKLRLVGHSIGAWVVLECLRDPVLRAATVDVHLLFPFLARNDFNATQRLIATLLALPPAHWVVLALVWLLCLLPRAVRRLLLGLADPTMSSEAQQLTLDTLLAKPWLAKSVLTMGQTEFVALDSSNAPLAAASAQIQSLCDQDIPVHAMYAPNDHWGPLKQMAELNEAIRSPKYHPVLVDVGHAYVTNAQDVLEVLAAWPLPARPTAPVPGSAMSPSPTLS